MSKEEHWKVRPRLILLILAVLIVIQRTHTYHEPLEYDLTSYAIIGHELLQGRSLYSDLWDHKPPGIHVTNAIAEALVGYGPAAIYLLGIVASLVTLIGCYVAGKAYAQSGRAGLWAATFWTLICSDCALEANQPNTEVFINACLIWAFALFVQSDADGFNVRRMVFIALLITLSSFYKYITIVPALFLVSAYAAFSCSPAIKRRSVFLRVTAMIGIVIGMWLILYGYFAATGRMSDWHYALVTFNRGYAGDIVPNIIMSLNLTAPFAPLLVWPLILMILLAFGNIRAACGADEWRPWVILTAFALGIHIMVAMPGQFYPHYYQLYLPLLVIGAAWSLESLRRSERRYIARTSTAMGIVAVAVLIAREAPLYRLSGEEWSRRKYGPQFIVGRSVGEEIGSLLKRDETFYVWANASGLYYYARCRPPSGILFNFPLLSGQGARQLQSRVVGELERARPELFVIDRRDILKGPVIDWFKREYQPLPYNPDRWWFTLYARRGGELEKRWSAPDIQPVE